MVPDCREWRCRRRKIGGALVRKVEAGRRVVNNPAFLEGLGSQDFESLKGGGDERGPAAVGGGVDVETVLFEEGCVGLAVFGEEG